MNSSNSNSRNTSAGQDSLPEIAYTSRSGSRRILGERILPLQSSPEDTIMSDESYVNQTHSSDTTMSGEYCSDGTDTEEATIPRVVVGLAPQLPPHQRYVSAAARHHQGILEPSQAAEDAAFFARANRQYQQRIQEIVSDNEKRDKNNSRADNRGKAASISNPSRRNNAGDVFRDCERNSGRYN